MEGLERTLDEVIIKRNDIILSGGRDQGCGVNNTILETHSGSVTLSLIISSISDISISSDNQL